MDKEEQPVQLVLDGFHTDSPKKEDGEPAGFGEGTPDPEIITPTHEQWAALYKIAMEIRKLSPWKTLWDSDLITIRLPGYDEPFYCSTLGKNGDCYAIAVYPGYQAFVSYERLAGARGARAELIAGCEQICLICNFGNREEVSPIDREIYKSLGLKFRGRNECIFFRSMEPGFAPWYLDAKEADLLIRILKHFSRAYSHMIKHNLAVDFDNGEILARYYSPDDKLWLNQVEYYPDRTPYARPAVTITDDPLIRRLLQKKQNSRYLELDLGFLPIPFRDKTDARPYTSRLIALADRQTGISLDSELVRDGEETVNGILNMFISHVTRFGRPSRIYIRNDLALGYIEDLCGKLKIKVVEGEGMPALDSFYAEMDKLLDR